MMRATLAPETDGRSSVVSSSAVAKALGRRGCDYLMLTKPRIAIMALFTVAIGYLLAAGPQAQFRVLLHTLVGASLVAAGGSALNQLLERRTDARMRRTANRPLPAGRLRPEEVAAFGATLSGAGLAYLAATVPAAATIAALLTLVLYVLVYTPLKQVTSWNTVVGAVPGALPPVIGWCAAGSIADVRRGVILFLILFLWQLPHFFAIAWMYRSEYRTAGYRMLPGQDPQGIRTAIAMILTASLLLVASLATVPLGLTSWFYAAGATAVGIWFVRQTIRFGQDRTDGTAKRVLRASLVYLPAVLGLLVLDALLG
jgi:protoheme IX farnesyltransferase